MMSGAIKVAVIGSTGRGNYGHGIDTVWKDVPATTLVAVADDHPAGLAEARQRLSAPQGYADYRDMLAKERPHIVGIGPRWIDRHEEMALACAEHGCHLFVEKPFVRTPAEADAVIRACESRHLKLALAHQSRYSPVNHRVRQLLRDGVIGDLLEIRGRGKEDARGGGEDLWVLGSHVLDLMQFFAGPATRCWATVTQEGRPIDGKSVVDGNEGLGPLAGDAIHARFAFANGVLGDFSTVRNRAGRPSRFGLQLFGSKGVIDIVFGYQEAAWLLPDPGWSAGRNQVGWKPISSAGIGVAEPLPDRGIAAGNVRAVEDLLDAIARDRQPVCSMYDGRATTEMILAVYSSAVANGPVELPLVDRQHPLATLLAGR
jgi:predicted dehydrogenase